MGMSTKYKSVSARCLVMQMLIILDLLETEDHKRTKYCPVKGSGMTCIDKQDMSG